MSKLFDLDLQLDPDFTNEDLKALILAHPEYDLNYVAIHARPDFKKVKDYFEKSWSTFEKIADKNFKSEFRTTAFHERAWELLLNQVFIEQGLVPEAAGNGGPDFKLPILGRSLWVEAVNAKKGDGPNAVETMQDLLKDLPSGQVVFSRTNTIDEANRPKVRRITSALGYKLGKYNSSYKGKLVKADDYFVVAISGAEIDGNMSGPALLLEALGGVSPNIHLPLLKDGTLGSPFQTTRANIPNASSTSTIDVNWFEKDEAKELSGVVYQGTTTYSSILQDEIPQGMIFIHNPHCLGPKSIPMEVFSFMTQIYFDPSTSSWITVPPK